MPKRFSFILGVFTIALIPLFSMAASEEFDLVINNGRVMDPESGLDAIRHIGIIAGRMVSISEQVLEGERIINATGLVVAPGFVDIHAHGQSEEAYRLMVQDGVTSGFELEIGTAAVADWYRERAGGQVLNYGISIGHIPVRMVLFGDGGQWLPSGPGGSGIAGPDMMDRMTEMMRQGLAEGAVAMGFGLQYTPAATQAEFEAMLAIAAETQASVHIHIRGGLEGLRQIITSANNAGTPLHIVHANSSGGSSIGEFLSIIQAARDAGQDVTTEMYPYGASYSEIASALFDNWETWEEDRFDRNMWVATGERLTRESFARYRQLGGGVITFSRTEEMTRTALQHPLMMIASDGRIVDGKGHPRSAGSFSKVLGQYVREEQLITLMDALRRMTIEPARRLEAFVPSMANKGRIRVGADADITVFDPESILDQATYVDPNQPSAGIEYVLVNGGVVLDNGVLDPRVRNGVAIKSN
ncbi:MAG: amidohydrolase family protein [Gammaproteobacteria bacterium]|nr:D-glutamate deacylase [Gammaproteobacteria bacterium]MDP6096097.1 amidohydrolase family protein [Gammaproteobacteria bacterium]MDP7455614.1 amidohydrolase family protein [Gammaproteobacteria bacterium]HJO12658.1 amidohydrolase family protein [Gammaproteobacteria bacterium]